MHGNTVPQAESCASRNPCSTGSGMYDYELLWTRTNENTPYAHATGQVGRSLPALNSVTGGTSGSNATLVWNVGGAAGTAVLHYRPANTTGAWSLLSASTVQTPHWNTGQTSGTPDYYTDDPTPFDLSQLAAGSYDSEVLFTPAGAGSPTMRTGGTLSVTAAQAGYYTTTTQQVWVPATSQSASMAWTSTNSLGITVNPSTLVWTAVASGSGSMLYRVYGSGSAWSTLTATSVAYWNTGQQSGPPSGYRFTIDFSSLAANKYETQIRYTPTGGATTQNTGNLTVTTPTAGHYTTQTTQTWHPATGQTASFSVVNTPFFAEANASPGTTSISTSGGGISEVAQTNGASNWVRPTISQSYDRWGNVLSVTDPRAATWKTYYTYNDNNQATSETQPDINGALSASSPVTRWYYDALGRQIAVRDARTSISADGKTSTAVAGNINGQQYDAAGNLIKEIHADGGTVLHGYNAFGDEVKLTDARSHVTLTTVDHLGHKTAIAHAAVDVYTVDANETLINQGNQALTDTMAYDEAGHLVSKTAADGQTTTYRYDLAGNIVVTNAAGSITKDAWDTNHNKTAEQDADNHLATWTYNAFSQLTAHTDLGGAVFAYGYDRAGQLASETIQGGQRPASQTLTYGYDAAGQLISINDAALSEVTAYAYDRAGHRVRETITQAGKTYQDNHLAYDTLGRLRDITTDQAHLTINYDNAGNRTYIGTHVYTNDGTSLDSQRYYLYDAMNRQTLVDGIDASGTLSSTQGHRLTYDQNGNRTTDTRVTTRVTYNAGTATYTYGANQEVAESYGYDAMDRLTTVTRNDGINNSTTIDHRYYDQGSRVVQTGVTLDAGYAAGMDDSQGDSSNPHFNHYDAQGRLIRQTVKSYGNALETIIDYTGIDAMGNVTGYRVSSYAGSSYTANYTLSYLRFDSYQQSTTSATGTVWSGGGTFTPSTITNTFDANGNVTRVDDSSDATKTRHFVNDAQGHVVWVQRLQGVEQQLVVGGEVLGRYGMSVDPTKPLVNGQPQYSDRADFNFGYQSARSQGMNGPMVHTVASGETLQGMAQAYYGDGSLWYLIADANGLTSDADMQVGQTLMIPARTAGTHNTANTFASNQFASGLGGQAEAMALVMMEAVSAYLGMAGQAGQNRLSLFGEQAGTTRGVSSVRSKAGTGMAAASVADTSAGWSWMQQAQAGIASIAPFGTGKLFGPDAISRAAVLQAVAPQPVAAESAGDDWYSLARRAEADAFATGRASGLTSDYWEGSDAWDGDQYNRWLVSRGQMNAPGSSWDLNRRTITVSGNNAPGTPEYYDEVYGKLTDREKKALDQGSLTVIDPAANQGMPAGQQGAQPSAQPGQRVWLNSIKNLIDDKTYTDSLRDDASASIPSSANEDFSGYQFNGTTEGATVIDGTGSGSTPLILGNLAPTETQLIAGSYGKDYTDVRQSVEEGYPTLTITGHRGGLTKGDDLIAGAQDRLQRMIDAVNSQAAELSAKNPALGVAFRLISDPVAAAASVAHTALYIPRAYTSDNTVNVIEHGIEVANQKLQGAKDWLQDHTVEIGSWGQRQHTVLGKFVNDVATGAYIAEEFMPTNVVEAALMVLPGIGETAVAGERLLARGGALLDASTEAAARVGGYAMDGVASMRANIGQAAYSMGEHMAGRVEQMQYQLGARMYAVPPRSADILGNTVSASGVIEGAGSGEKMVMVYRGTNIGIENQMYDASGHLFSDAARQGFYETGTVEGAYSRAKITHQQWLDVFGNEGSYVEAHSSEGLELSGNYGGIDRTFMSVTDSLSEAARFADVANGGRVYGGLVPESMLLGQTLGTAGESEYLIRFGTDLLRPISIGGF